MRMLSLAVFAAVALVVGAYEAGRDDAPDRRRRPRSPHSRPCRDSGASIFLSMLSDLFAAETILFGVADIVSLTGYWPKAYEDYELPRYLPLATALFGVVIFAVSHFPFVQQDVEDHRPFFAARTPISIRPWPLPPMTLQPEPLRPHQRLLPDPHQPIPGGDRRSSSTSSTGRSATPSRFPTKRIWASSGISSCGSSRRWSTIAILAVLGRVLRCLELRPAMAALDDGLVTPPAGSCTRCTTAGAQRHQRRQPRQPVVAGGQNRQPGSAHLGGHRRLHQRRRRPRNLLEPGHLQLHHFGDVDRDQSGGVLDHPVGALRRHGPHNLRRYRFTAFLFWVAVLYACFATGMMQLIGRSLSRLMFRQQAVEANFRFDLARIREFSEQIALLEGRGAGDRPRAPGVRRRLHAPSSASFACAPF